MNRKLTNLLKNGGLFFILLALTAYMILKDTGLTELVQAVKKANPAYLAAGVFAMGLFLFCEGVNLTRALRFFGKRKISLCQGIKYAMAGFFGSSVTPSASGGQPLQLYFMHKDGHRLSHGTLVLLFELLSFQTVTITLAIFGFFYQHGTISEAMGKMQYLLLIGTLLNAMVLIILFCAVFSGKMVHRLAGFVVQSVQIFSSAKAEGLREKLSGQIEEYSAAAVYLKENRSMFAKTILTTLVQILAMYAVPYLVYKSFGLNSYTMSQVISLQAVLYVAVSALPLPGALGVSESGFMMLFSTLFPAAFLPSAMVLSRGISFYLFVLISGIATAFFTVYQKGRTNDLQHFNCRGRSGHCPASEALSGKQRISHRCRI